MEERIDIVVDSSAAKRGIDVLVDSVNRMTTSLNRAESTTTKFFQAMEGGLKRLESAFFSLRSIATSFTVVIGAFRQLGQELTKFQAFISAMSVSVGGIEKARKEYSFLMDMADRLGISINSLSHNYSQLAAATNGTAITTDGLRKIFESFSVAARVMHLSGQDTRLMFYALTQMVSKGAVSMEELRRQLGEKLPGAMKIAASSVNATSDELETAIRKGIVDPVKFLPIFADAVRKTFGPGLTNAMTALDAEINRMTNSLQKMIIVFYDLGVADAFTRIIKEINRILEDTTNADTFGRAIKKLADEVTTFLRTIGPDEVRSFVSSFSNALATMGQVAGNILPIMKQLAEYSGLIIGGYLVLKGTVLGAAAGQAVAPGPVGGTVGGIIGGVGAGIGAYGIYDAITNPSKSGRSGATYGTIRRAEDGGNLNSWYFTEGPGAGSGRRYTINDILGGKGKVGSATPMDNFIEQLKERSLAAGEETNKFDALRARAQFLGKANPERLQEALKYIDDLEARGDEFNALINRIEGMIDRQNRATPDTVDRAVQDLMAKYPKAVEKHKDAMAAAATFRSQYEAKLAAEKQLFLDKQDEIIRRIGVEKDLYAEQVNLIGKTANEREKILKRLDMERRLEEDIVRLKQESLRSGREFDESGFRARGKQAIDQVISEISYLQEAERTVQAGFTSAVSAYYDAITNMAQHTNQIITSSFKGIEDALVAFVRTGRLSFRALVDDILNQLARITIQRGVMAPIMNLVGLGGATSGSGGSLNIGGLGGLGGQFFADFGNFFGNIGSITEAGSTFGLMDAIMGFASANPIGILAAGLGAFGLGKSLFGKKKTPAQLTGKDLPSGIANYSGLSGTVYGNDSGQGYRWAGEQWSGVFQNEIKSVYDRLDKIGRALGYDTTGIRGYSANITTGQFMDASEILPSVLEQLSDQLVRKVIPNFDELTKAGETAAETLERLGSDLINKALDQVTSAYELQQGTADLWLSELSPLTATERLNRSNTRYNELLTLARGGDVSAVNELQSFVRSNLGEAASYYGTANPQYRAIFEARQDEIGGLTTQLIDQGVEQLAVLGVISSDLKNLPKIIADAIDVAAARIEAAQEDSAEVISEAVQQTATDTAIINNGAAGASFWDSSGNWIGPGRDPSNRG